MIGDMVGTMEELNLQQCVLNADGWFFILRLSKFPRALFKLIVVHH